MACHERAEGTKGGLPRRSSKPTTIISFLTPGYAYQLRRGSLRSPLRFERRLAEREGFEPSIRLLGIYSLSRRAPSADSAISPIDSREIPCGNFAYRNGKNVVFPLLTDRAYSLWHSIRAPLTGAVVKSSYRERPCGPFLTDRTYGLWPSIRAPFTGAVVKSSSQFAVHVLRFTDH